MQCQVFSGTRVSTLENRINNWLKENESAKVKFVTQSESPAEDSLGGEKTSGLTISIFYE